MGGYHRCGPRGLYLPGKDDSPAVTEGLGIRERWFPTGSNRSVPFRSCVVGEEPYGDPKALGLSPDSVDTGQFFVFICTSVKRDTDAYFPGVTKDQLIRAQKGHFVEY